MSVHAFKTPTNSGPMHDIKAVLAATDLAALIGEDIELHRLQACCPFHDEKTPSFTVAPEKQFYHCFGCGAHGDALDWMVQYRRLPFRAALEALAGAAGIGIDPIDNSATRARKARAVTVEIEAALAHELHVLYSAVGSRVSYRAISKQTLSKHPHIAKVPDAPLEREYEAAQRIAKALYALYGARA